MSRSGKLVRAARELGQALDHLEFGAPVTHVYNPLGYAWRAHETYLRTWGGNSKRVVFLGMNPGPFGMVQTGVPFGEIGAVRDWLRIETPVGKPRVEHPKRPVEGFACHRSEVSGRRLWGLFAEQFGAARNFFADHFVLNYCPLAFFDAAGRNLTPDKLRASETAALFDLCDRHLRSVVEILNPEWLIGVGDFAERRARLVLPQFAIHEAKRGDRPSPASSVKIGKILHPSPASPAANRDWAKQAAEQLRLMRIWKP